MFKRHFALSGGLVLGLFVGGAGAAEVLNTITGGGFGVGGVGGNMSINGDASIPLDVDLLRLTPRAEGLAGSAFYANDPNPVALTALSDGFSAFFSFRTMPLNTVNVGFGGGDGFTFTLHTVQNSGQPDYGIVGDAGENLGYQGDGVGPTNDIIFPSVAVEFDTFSNDNLSDPMGSNHVGFLRDGSVDHGVGAVEGTDVYSGLNLGQLSNGRIWYAWLDYDAATTTLELRASHTASERSAAPLLLSKTIDLNLIFEDAFGNINPLIAGFTAATGSAFQSHDILEWVVRDTLDPVTGLMALHATGTDGDFGDAGTWVETTVPDANLDVVLGSNGGTAYTVSVPNVPNVPTTARNVTVEKDATLNVDPNFVSNILNTEHLLLFGGNIFNEGQINVASGFTWTGGTIEGTGTINVLGNEAVLVGLGGTEQKFLRGVTLSLGDSIFFGGRTTTTWYSEDDFDATIHASQIVGNETFAVIVNHFTQNFNILSDGVVMDNVGISEVLPIFENRGTLSKVGGDLISFFAGVRVDNLRTGILGTATVNVNVGTLMLGGGGLHESATFNIAHNAVLDLGGVLIHGIPTLHHLDADTQVIGTGDSTLYFSEAVSEVFGMVNVNRINVHNGQAIFAGSTALVRSAMGRIGLFNFFVHGIDSNAEVDVESGGLWDVDNALDVGVDGPGRLVVQNGGHVRLGAAGDAAAALNVGSFGTVDLLNATVTAPVFNVAEGGMVNGLFGDIVGNVDNRGTISPGSGISTGPISIDGNYVQRAGGVFEIEISDFAAGAHDRLVLTDVGNVAQFEAGSIFKVRLIDGFMPAAGNFFDVFETNLGAGIGNQTLAGIVFDFSMAALGPGLFWERSIVGLGGTDEAIRLSVVVPEPASLGVMVVGAVGLMMRRRGGESGR